MATEAPGLELDLPASTERSIRDALMTAEGIADVLQMRVSNVEGYARRGPLPSIEVVRHRRFIQSEVKRAIFGLAR
jgi:hypothetical protein